MKTTALPRISIGMPVYNGAKYIRAAIDSILRQSYSAFELIICDNASTDATREICLDYARGDGRVRYERNSHNLGAAPNYNRVFSLASGEYFKWADYDDLLAPDFLAKCVRVLDENRNVILVYPLSRIIDEHGNDLDDYQYKVDVRSPLPHVRFSRIALTPDTAFQVSGLMRSEAIRKTSLHGSFPVSDLVFLAELSLWGEFYELPEYLFFPRSHAEQGFKGELAIERNRTVFFDTKNEGRILLPKWQYLNGHFKSIRRSRLSARQKLYCSAQMIRWVLKPDHFRAMGKDVLIALGKLAKRARYRTARSTQAVR